MRLIHPSYKIETPLDVQQVHRSIEAAGRTCYKSEHKITGNSATEFVRMVLARGHESVIEHQSMTVRFIVDRGVSHEIVRHRLCAFSQESTRYCDYGTGDVVFIIPPWAPVSEGRYAAQADIEGIGPWRTWITAMLDAEEAYHQLREEGWKPQEARAVLPNSLKTEIVVTANLREWRHILKLRTSSAAHPQMREVMSPLLQELHCHLPVIFDDIMGEAHG
jgi:thymidylate synthase (FAD)